ncbi:AT-rich interactive domain-containing protein 5B [Chamberlinius hualienensis]
MTVSSQLVGSPCGQRGSYLFYKSFRLWKNGKTKSISVGDCFFVNTTFSPTLSPTVDGLESVSAGTDANTDGTLCIGELQLLWEDKNINRTLTSCRLYFLPENTPEGRLEHHGEDEVLAMSERVVLHVDDLVQWIAESDVSWERGLKGLYSESTAKSDPDEHSGQIQSEVKDDIASQVTLNNADVDVTEDDLKNLASDRDPDELAVKILSYPQYCRYRAILKRLEHMPESWFYNALVIALGGFTVSSPNWRLLFCRETFEHPELDSNELHCGHLAPCLKGRRKKKQLKKKRSNSPSSESNESVELQLAEYDSKCGLKAGVTGEELVEQEFLERLFKFMRRRNTPIERIPHLGFKQINLYIFYTYVQKLGGYHTITAKKLWKQIYDELGGDPGSTSAATNTRRHYERLLLLFERHENSQNRSPKVKQKELDTSRSSPVASPSVPLNDTECLTPKNSVSTETVLIENSLSPISVQHDKDYSISQQPQRTSQSPANNLMSISLTQPLKLDLKQPTITLIPVCQPPPLASTISEQSISKSEYNSPTTVCDLSGNTATVMINVLQVSQPNSTLLIKPSEAHAQIKTPCPLPKKRAQDEHEVGKQWEEIRRKHALEKEKLKQIPLSKTSSLRSLRVTGKDPLTKSLLAAECQNPTYVKPFSTISTSSLTAGNVSSIPLNNGSSCSSGIDNPKMVTYSAPTNVYNAQFNSYCDKKQMKHELIENRRSVIDAPNVNGNASPVLVDIRNNCPSTISDSNGIYQMYKSKETNSYNGCMRPSVIQHTLNTTKRSVYANSYEDMMVDNSSKPETKSILHNESNKRPLEASHSIPAAHQNNSTANNYSLTRDFNNDGSGRQNDYYAHYNINNVSGIPTVMSSIQNKSFMPPPSSRMFNVARRSSPSPWTSSSPNGRPPSAHSIEKRLDSKDTENEVLDLSCNKKLKSSTNNASHSDKFKVNSYSEVQELDLSLKSKRYAVNEVNPEQNVLNSHGGIPAQLADVKRQNEAFYVSNAELNAPNFQDYNLKNKPDKRIPPGVTATSTPSTVQSLPSHGSSFVPTNNKIPIHYSADYNSQPMPNIMSSNFSPSYFGLPFHLPTPNPALLHDQLQVNFASVYKDIYPKRVYHPPISYPVYDFSPALYSLYKDQNSSYVYYNPK